MRDWGGDGENRLRRIAIVFACCLTCGIPSAMILSTAGLFYPLISDDLGVPTAQISAWMSISMLTSAIISPLTGNLIARYNVRNFMLLGVLASALAFFIFSRGDEPWLFWIAGGITGYALVTCLSLIPTVLVNRWFSKHVGFLLGLCTSFTGIGGVVFLALGQGIIDAYGWRAAYMAFAVITLVVCMPTVFICVRDWPSEGASIPQVAAGEAPAVGEAEASPPLAPARLDGGAGDPDAERRLPGKRGALTAGAIAGRGRLVRRRAASASGGAAASGGASAGVDARNLARRQMRTPAFWLLVGSGFFMNLVCQVNGYFPLYVNWIDEQAAYGLMAGSYTTGAMLLALSQVGNAAGKLGLGAAVDLSPGKALALLTACGVLGTGCVWLAPSTPLMALGGLLFGFFIAGGLVLLPMLVRGVFGSGDNYPLVFSRISVAPTAGSAVGNVLFPALAEGAGGFSAVFMLTLACVIAVLLLSIAAVSSGRRSETGML